ncbi:hypothetical protein [Cytophaga aurantiaca]|uniref:hypothetical protein n=1 Tax=Cytophaga aurantiaca TaxID=29530 RepID=UPI00039A1EF3|nr:hypothetical protein [Cytophaga aurantiaca]
MNRIVLYIFLLFMFIGSTQFIFAQIPFVQANQLPLLLSPSMAGSKEQKRVSIGANNFISDDSKGSNLAICYDQMIEKFGCGVGIYYLQNSFKDNLITDNYQFSFSENIRNKKYYTIENQKTLGICIAPKYNITYKNNPYKIKYTFSPSVFLELGNSVNTMLCNPIVEHVYLHYDSTNYYKYSYNNSSLRYGVGGQLNSKKLLLLGKLGITRNSYSEQISYATYAKSSNTESETQPISENSIFYSLQSTFHIGYTFCKNPNTSLSFTPIFGIGIIHYFGLDAHYVQPNSNKYRYNINPDQLTEINYLHASANMRFKKFLFGASYSKNQTSIYKGITFGFQNNRMKVMCSMGFNFYKTLSTYHQAEVTSGFFF